MRSNSEAEIVMQDSLRVEAGLHVVGNITCDGNVKSPFWVAGNINGSGQVLVNKGLHIMSSTKVPGDSAIDVFFPAHPDGDRYTVSISSTEFHTLYRNQTSTSFRLHARSSKNVGGYACSGLFSIMIML